MSDDLQAWLRGQVQEYGAVEYPRHQEYARTLREILDLATRDLGPHVIVQARPKTVPSFAEKALRKRDKYRDPVHQFTDLSGARVITHTLDEVTEVCEFISTHFEIDPANSLDAVSRLGADQFGYRSVHHIVQLRPGKFPTRDVPVQVSDKLLGLKAEIQVRTIAQHCWADIRHDRIYKGSFKVPAKWERESARAAALLEDVDETFTRVVEGLETYRASVGAYLSEKEMDEEIEILRNVQEFAGGDLKLAHQLALLLMGRGRWAEAIKLLEDPRFRESAPLLHALGQAKCQEHRDDRHGEGYREGRVCLEKAVHLDSRNIDALTDLARTWRGIDDEKALNHLEKAYAIDSTNPQTLAEYVELKIAEENSLAFLPLIRPILETAIGRCRDQAEVKVNLPWAYFRMGEFYLLLGRHYESLGAYAKAIQLSAAEFMIDQALLFVRRVWKQRKGLPGLDWVRQLLLLGKSVKFHNATLDRELIRLAPDPRELFKATPVMIVAGGCDAAVNDRIAQFRQLLIDAFRGFRGTILCGGTTAGISGLVGDLSEHYGDRIRSIGYLPRLMPDWAVKDDKYSKVLTTDGTDFSPLEPLQNWIDLLAAGIAPEQVRLLGINGGDIAAFEYRLALALGATVGILRESGREAGRLLWDTEWENAGNPVFLPTDLMTIRAFVSPPAPLDAGPDGREKMGRKCHEVYRGDQQASVLKQHPSLADWPDLPPYLRESNRQLADHIAAKLEAVGRQAFAAHGSDIVLAELTPEEIELMAEMEHGRWNLERLLDGWTMGPRDTDKKIHPYLIPWQDLPENVKEYDRQFVRKIPEILKEIGMEVRPIQQAE